MTSTRTQIDPNESAGSIYGFRVSSEQPLQFLRSGGGDGVLEILETPTARARPTDQPLSEWMLPGTEYEARASLYRVGDGFEFWATDVGGFHVDPAKRRIQMPPTGNTILREQRLWGVPLILCYTHRGDFSLHAAAVDIGAGAILLAAPSRHGKTTLALAFHRHGYRILSEDLVCCRSDNTPEILPGPALLRVRRDVYDGVRPLGTHIAATTPDRVFLALDGDRKGSSAPVPLIGVVFLRQADGLRMELTPPSAALPDLWHLSFRLATQEHRAQSFQRLARLVASVPCWNLYRPLTLESLDATVELIATRLIS